MKRDSVSVMVTTSHKSDRTCLLSPATLIPDTLFMANHQQHGLYVITLRNPEILVTLTFSRHSTVSEITSRKLDTEYESQHCAYCLS